MPSVSVGDYALICGNARKERRGGLRGMKFKTRIRVTFVSIILVPLIMTIVAYLAIALYLVNARSNGSKEMDNIQMNENFEYFIGKIDSTYDEFSKLAEENPDALGDLDYMQKRNDDLVKQSAYLMVRKGTELFYAGNPQAEKLLPRLPKYQNLRMDEHSGFYFLDLDRYVKQMDFTFPDGEQGSVFIVATMHTLVSKQFLAYMFIAIGMNLIVTSLMLTHWMQKGVFNPVAKLNIAMQRIKEGSFDYALETTEAGEIGDLYRNYEDMRLRLKELAQEKENNEKQNRELISNISHDLKTPITSIKGYVEGIMDGVADSPEKMNKYIRTIYNKANDMDRLINELTTYSNIDNHRIQYNFQRINVTDYFGDCVEEVGLDLDSRNIKLNYSNLTDPSTVVIADAEQMKKVINNIIGNSVKYMDKSDGCIDIRILDQEDSIQVEIEDNGKGIAPKDLAKIFERFYRTDASRNSAQGGSGIGLSIVKKIIEDHGGYIWATSEEGKGTCMHFVLRKYIEL